MTKSKFLRIITELNVETVRNKTKQNNWNSKLLIATMHKTNKGFAPILKICNFNFGKFIGGKISDFYPFLALF